LERVTPPKGYVLSEQQRMQDVLAVEAELLRSEGVDPRWPGFGEEEDDSRETTED
jgi:hypothetical protein